MTAISAEMPFGGNESVCMCKLVDTRPQLADIAPPLDPSAEEQSKKAFISYVSSEEFLLVSCGAERLGKCSSSHSGESRRDQSVVGEFRAIAIASTMVARSLSMSAVSSVGRTTQTCGLSRDASKCHCNQRQLQSRLFAFERRLVRRSQIHLQMAMGCRRLSIQSPTLLLPRHPIQTCRQYIPATECQTPSQDPVGWEKSQGDRRTSGGYFRVSREQE